MSRLRAWWNSGTVVRVRLSLRLLTERRAALFISIDALFLFGGLMMGLAGSGSVREFWQTLFLMPLLVIGVPMLAETVAVERRSGTLDLALTSPGARFYFERSVAAVITVAVLQGWLAMLFVRLLMRSEPFPLSGPFVQIVSASLFAGAVVLSWAVRVRSAGAVIFATYATALAFAPWLFSNPIHPPTTMNGPMTIGDMIGWSQDNLVLLAAAAAFYLYARQRLARPEAIIT
ncbi:MAG TPA: hypothetical protein VHX14_12640 [Thermoanaerobaculia bacterium]|nr:hypothetical protein [Thermoanaerobaculia bacterium]